MAVPVIDVKNIDGGVRKAIMAQIPQACESTGFFQMITPKKAPVEEDLEQQLGESEEEIRAKREKALEWLQKLPAIFVPITVTFLFTVPIPSKGHIKDHEFALNVLLLGDIVAFYASTILLVILGIMPSVYTSKLVLLSKVVLCISVGFFALSFLAAAYMLMPAAEKWFVITVGFGTVVGIGSAFLYIISLG